MDRRELSKSLAGSIASYALFRTPFIVDLRGEKWEVDNIDPHTAERIADGRLRVRKPGVDEALRKYGHDKHH